MELKEEWELGPEESGGLLDTCKGVWMVKEEEALCHPEMGKGFLDSANNGQDGPTTI